MVEVQVGSQDWLADCFRAMENGEPKIRLVGFEAHRHLSSLDTLPPRSRYALHLEDRLDNSVWLLTRLR